MLNNTTFVIQGGVFNERSICFINKLAGLSNNPLIISTWDNIELPFDAKNITVVKSPDPGPDKIFAGKNTNSLRQFTSTFRGFSFVKTDYAIKIRSDFSCDPASLISKLIFQNNIINVLSKNTHNSKHSDSLLFNICDWVLCADIKLLRYIFNYNFAVSHFNFYSVNRAEFPQQYRPEQIIGSRAYKFLYPNNSLKFLHAFDRTEVLSYETLLTKNINLLDIYDLSHYSSKHINNYSIYPFEELSIRSPYSFRKFSGFLLNKIRNNFFIYDLITKIKIILMR